MPQTRRSFVRFTVAAAAVALLPTSGGDAAQDTTCEQIGAEGGAPGTVLRGDGDAVTGAVPLSAGLSAVRGTHGGAANFAVFAYQADGSSDLLFNEIGPYDGEAALRLDSSSTVVFEVMADGPWMLTISSAFPA